MLINKKMGNIYITPVTDGNIDDVIVEWYEAHKRILHKKTKAGRDITLKFLSEDPCLEDGDILWQDESSVIAVAINPCKCIVFTPASMLSASSLCYEIGNRHLPLFYEGDDLMVPYDLPLHNLLKVSGYELKVADRKLNRALKTTVLPHLRVAGTDSLFAKIFSPVTSS